MPRIELSGLSGFNPLGFLAGLGVLRVLYERRPELDPRLGWASDGDHAVVEVGDELDLAKELFADVEAWRERAPELELQYLKNGSGPLVYDLKPPPPELRAFALGGRDRALAGERRKADYVAAYSAAHPVANGPDVGVDGKGNAKPTALHFTAGQQNWLEMVRQLRDICFEDLLEALDGPWSYSSKLPSLRWDATGERSYALLAGDPSLDKVQGNPGADWLAYRGLTFFPTFLRKGTTATRAVPGKGKHYKLWWALWAQPLDRWSVEGVLSGDLPKISKRPQERALRGLSVILCSTIRRTDQGGYGSFGPPDVV